MDGEQHFRPVKFFGGEKAFKKTKERDAIKDLHCASNNIHLLHIDYTVGFKDYTQHVVEFLNDASVSKTLTMRRIGTKYTL